MPAIEASTMFQLTISLSISLRTRRISWPMFSILKSVIPRWLRRMQGLGLLLRVAHLLGVGLEGPGVDGVRAHEVLLRGGERDVDLRVVPLHLAVVHLVVAELLQDAHDPEAHAADEDLPADRLLVAEDVLLDLLAEEGHRWRASRRRSRRGSGPPRARGCGCGPTPASRPRRGPSGCGRSCGPSRCRGRARGPPGRSSRGRPRSRGRRPRACPASSPASSARCGRWPRGAPRTRPRRSPGRRGPSAPPRRGRRSRTPSPRGRSCRARCRRG